MLTPRGECGAAPQATVSDLTFAYNVIRHTGSAINMAGNDDTGPSGQTSRLVFVHNLLLDVDRNTWGGDGRLFQVITSQKPVLGLKFEHNTAAIAGNAFLVMGDTVAVATGLVFRNNVVPHGDYGAFGSGKGEGTAALDAYAPGAVFTNNAIFGGGIAASYPAGNLFPATTERRGLHGLRWQRSLPHRAEQPEGQGLGRHGPRCRRDAGLRGDCRRRSLMTHWKRWLGALSLLQCCGSSCDGDRTPPELPTDPSPPVVQLSTSTNLPSVRVRLSKLELTVDCSATSFDAPVTDALFGPAHEVTLDTHPRPLYRPEDRPGSDQRCALLAFESKDGPVVVRTNPGLQSYIVDRDVSGKLSVSGASLVASSNGATVTCPKPSKLTWSDTTVTGDSIVEAVEAPAADGCQTLRLRPGSAAEGPSLSWSVCMGDTKLPFGAGDWLHVSQNENPANNARVLRMARTVGDRTELWLMRGNPSGFTATGWDGKLFTLSSSQRAADCRSALAPGCGTLEVALDTVLTFGPRSVQLRGGEGVSFGAPDGSKVDARIVHALMRPVVDPACSKDAAAAPTDVGVVVLVRGGPSGRAKEIAAPAPK